MPSYVIMPNATLLQLVAARPQTAAALARIKGFGPARLERYGDELLALLRGPDPAGA
jgi:superfamily II DNA helicase RecQ